jgi:hypothetical protein
MGEHLQHAEIRDRVLELDTPDDLSWLVRDVDRLCAERDAWRALCHRAAAIIGVNPSDDPGILSRSMAGHDLRTRRLQAVRDEEEAAGLRIWADMVGGPSGQVIRRSTIRPAPEVADG